MANALQKILNKLEEVNAGTGASLESVIADVNEAVGKSEAVVDGTHDADI